MPNAQLDAFMHALMWKAVPAIILAGLAGLLLRELFQWFERSITRGIRARRNAQKAKPTKPSPLEFDLSDNPHCPLCNGAMVKRKARRGQHAGEEFWGCSGFPKCHGTRPI